MWLEINICNANTQHGMKGFKITSSVRRGENLKPHIVQGTVIHYYAVGTVSCFTNLNVSNLRSRRVYKPQKSGMNVG
jgi:hypothetical protein